MTFKNYSHWSALIGAVVQIHHNGRIIRSGTVDDVTADSAVLWIAAEGVHPRAMYEAALGYQAWVKPQELTGDSSFRYRMTAAILYPRKSAPMAKAN